MSNPKVSVIVPIYNAEAFLVPCIKSVLTQTLEDIEVLLIDDGSSDSSAVICRHFMQQDARVTVINKENEGVSATRNLGLTWARGEYIAFLDADDTLIEQALEVLVQTLEEKQVDAVFANYFYHYNEKKIYRGPRIPGGIYPVTEIRSQLIDDGTLSGILFGSVGAALYKKELIDQHHIRFQEEVALNEDGLFNVMYLLQSSSCCYLSDQHIYGYRKAIESVTSRFQPNKNFDSATIAIDRYCQPISQELFLEQQLRRRRVSISLWQALNICSEENPASYRMTIRQLKELFGHQELQGCFPYMEEEKMNRYKRFYYQLIKKRRTHIFYLMTRFLLPTASRLVKR
ncbi:glycosyltransferase family 2 protein [Desemzia sp. RIT804]|uniref:glycosyltransferase family 2 protein n=1 Tax=Desemzia sp. RIT 804 TaxID=2810209 RepID=UPI00194FE897|nr:glycosyltransferase family 2 protein [Desemzia sp. RIT 804]MBM6614819.1 glycosyltransferase family 2 protein [Desemzia sp. RIT 804]